MNKTQWLSGQVVRGVLQGNSLPEALAVISCAVPDRRAAIQELSYGVIRYYPRLQAVLSVLVTRKLSDQGLQGLLLVALYQLAFQRSAAHVVVDSAVTATGQHRAPWFKGLVNGVLRNFLRRREAILAEVLQDEVALYCYPAWWITRLKMQYPDQWQDILDTGNQRPLMTVRVNCRRTTVADYVELLTQQGIAAMPLGQSAIRLDTPVSVEKLPGFTEGLVSVQDYGAQQAACLLDVHQGMRVLDACAAPGGKTGHLLEIADIDLYALDSDAGRHTRTHSNLTRLGLSATLLVGDASQPHDWQGGLCFDRILADVPCSASGVVRRHVDIKWLRRESDIGNFAERQYLILEALWQLLANDGKLLYATCSVFYEENQLQVASFLQQHRDARRLPLTGIPDSGQMLPNIEHDGFFYALLQKI